jgi:energy-coupling factor transporter ATP-binding protein EcfA2
VTDVLNPFRPTKYEFARQRRQVLWLSPQAVALQGEQSFYIYGPRGSGKTSLLRSLNWKERAENETLRPQLSSAQQKTEFIAVYMCLPNYVSGRFAAFDWQGIYPQGDAEEIAKNAFHLFVEFVALRLLFEGIVGLVARGALSVTRSSEKSIVSHILNALPELTEYYGPHRLINLEQCASMLKYYHEYIRKSMTLGANAEDFEVIPFEKAGGLLQSASEAIIEALENDNESLSHVKVCIDDCEMLTRQQQLYLNSLIRHAESPLFWIISYVSPVYETTATTIPAQTLSDADRLVIDLDTAPEETFLELCEQVSALRLMYSERKTANAPLPPVSPESRKFKLRDVLGETSVNAMLQRVHARGNSAVWKGIEADARQLANAGGSFRVQEFDDRSIFDEVETESGVLPYYEAFLLRRLGRLEAVLQGGGFDEAPGQRASIRRKQRAALLVICARTRTNIPYSGWQVVMGLSDGCIRDYLEIMASIFEEHLAGRPGRRANVRSLVVAPDKQRSGIVKSSRAKVVSIVDNAESYTAEAYKLIACLGELTRLLQANPDTVEPLRTAERGIFSIDMRSGRAVRESRDGNRERAVLDVIKECQTSGFLRAVGTGRGPHSTNVDVAFPQRFRLHRRFAPNFGFSYRGPYAVIPLTLGDLVEICTEPDKVNETIWANQMEQRLNNSSKQRARATGDDSRSRRQAELPLGEGEQ